MSLSVLNNIPSLVAQNNLAVTNQNLQNTLFQLSSGSRINSGADDPAGLSIVNGLQANISALTQSSQNATDGVGQLQVADGALSQVTTLLNRAVTLATEAANGGLTGAQFAAITNEYGSITSEINRIGQATNFNGTKVFSGTSAANANQAATTALAAVNANSVLTAGQTTSVQLGNGTAYTYTAGANASVVTGNKSVTTATTLANNETMSITNGNGTYTFTSGTLKESGASVITSGTALTGAVDSMTVSSGIGAADVFTGTNALHVSDLLTALNANTATNGISAYIDGAGHLQIQSSAVGATPAGNLTVTYGGTGAYGALTGTPNTVGDLINGINGANLGFKASLSGAAAGTFNVTSSTGAISLASGSNITELVNAGTALTATNTVQDLIAGIDGSGLGVTANLGTVTDPNKVVGATGAVTAAGTITGGTLTINSGTAVNGVSPNTYTYSYGTGVGIDPVTGAINNTTQGLVDSINSSGTPFHAFIDSNKNLEITDSSYSGNVAVVNTLTGNAAGPTGALGTAGGIQQLEVTDQSNRGDLQVASNDAALGFVANPGGNALKGGNPDAFVDTSTTAGASGANVFVSDGQVTGALNNTIAVAIGALSATQIGTTSTTLQGQALGTASGAASALTVINNAISDVASMRGTIGAGINRLNSATNVINTQIQNLTSAQSSMQDANIGQVVANMSKYQVLEQTGISALAQSNQNEQAVLKLLQ